MSTNLHFINVGQGNMVLIQLANGKVFLYDCNVTDKNEDDVLDYVARQIGHGTAIDVFICSHREADHMRGIKKVHAEFPIQKIWDSGVTGTSTDSAEYKEYMDLRRTVGFKEVKAQTRYDYGNTRLRIMNSKNDEVTDDCNSQSIVVKVMHRDAEENVSYASVMLTGDTDAQTWKDSILKHYKDSDLSCSLLLASHHGSITYFDDPRDEEHYYTAHIEAQSPDMTIVSVGDNSFGHPDKKALKLYEKYSSGSDKGNKIARTDTDGNICVTLKDGGGWSLSKNCE